MVIRKRVFLEWFTLKTFSFLICHFLMALPQFFLTNYSWWTPSKHSSRWIHLEDVFGLRLQDVLIKTNIFALLIRLQDVFIKINIFVLVIRLQDVFKTFSRRLQDVFKTFSRRLQDVLQKRLQDIFKTSSRRFENVFKTSSRRFQDVLSS